MDIQADRPEPQAVAARIVAEVQALPVANTPNVRAIRRRHSQALKQASGPFVLDVGRELLARYGYRWVAYELIAAHGEAFGSLGAGQLEELGQGMDSWEAVDSFARTLSGPAWRDGLVDDEVIHRWARSGDRWWRRAALVSTVALNVRSQGGLGDVARTLDVCRLLVADPDDMVVKALSWALRELAVHDPEAVQAFITEHEALLASRVKREVRNKLRTGLKNPHTG
ncbi:MAG TPA: DNA alkylation repair protein [Anaerolineae bacterium]|nr:DNA alkylation repair protein [Anaerolineae bacterium]